jgi:release factor glutamine methyltransferase
VEFQQETGRIGDLLLQAAARLEKAGVESARIDAELLLGSLLNKSRTELYLAAGEKLEANLIGGFSRLIERRAGREPLAYILGTTEFWSRTFTLSPAVLIPRPETEVLVEAVLNRKNRQATGGAYLDLCCGSGIICITLALETELQVHHMVGVDISRSALSICRQNCINHGVDQSIQLVQGDLGSCFAEQRSFRLITANPPYIDSAEMTGTLQPEVVDFEPHLALDGGEEGLELIRTIIYFLPGMLAPGGDFFMEIGSTQAATVREIFAQTNGPPVYESIDVLKDYAGRDRIVHARRL